MKLKAVQSVKLISLEEWTAAKHLHIVHSKNSFI